MANNQTIGITLTLNSQGAVVGAQALGNALHTVHTQGGLAGQSLQTAYQATVNFQRGIVNAVNGLQSLRLGVTNLTNLGVSQTKKMIETYADTEKALIGVAITMGKIGPKKNDPSLVREFQQISDEVMRIGRDSEFTTEEAAEMFQTFKQEGLSAATAVKAIEPTMAMSSASNGLLGLRQAALLGLDAMRAFHVHAKDLPKLMDEMTVAARETQLNVEQLAQTIHSFGPSKQTFKGTSTADFLGVAAMGRAGNRAPAEVGRDFQSFATSLTDTVLHLNDLAAGKGLKKRRTQALMALGFQKSDFVDTAGRYKNLITIIEASLARYNAAIGTLGEADARAQLQKAFGRQNAANMILQAKTAMDEYGVSARKVSSIVAKASGDTKNAQELYLEGLASQYKVFKGSVELIYYTLGATLAPLMKELVVLFTKAANAISDWAKANPKLAKAFTYSVIGLTIFSFALSKFLTMLIGGSLIYLAFMTPMAGSIRAMIHMASSMNIVRIVGGPMLLIIKEMVWAFAKLALTIGVLILAWKTDFGGFRTWITAWSKDIFAAVTTAFDLLTGGVVSTARFGAMTKRAQEFTTSLVVIFYRLKAAVEGFKEGLIAGFGPLLYVMEAAVRGITKVLDKLMEFFFGVKSSSGAVKDLRARFHSLGYTLGMLVAVYYSVRTALMTALAVQTLYTGALKLAAAWQLRFWAATTFGLIRFGAVIAAVRSYAATFAAFSFAGLFSGAAAKLAALHSGFVSLAGYLARASVSGFILGLAAKISGATTRAALFVATLGQGLVGRIPNALTALRIGIVSVASALWGGVVAALAFAKAILINPLTWILVGVALFGVLVLKLSSYVENWRGSFAKLAIALTLLGTGMSIFAVFAAMAVGATGALVILIGLFIILGLLVVKNWVYVKEAFVEVCRSISRVFNDAIDGMTLKWRQFANFVADNKLGRSLGFTPYDTPKHVGITGDDRPALSSPKAQKFFDAELDWDKAGKPGGAAPPRGLPPAKTSSVDSRRSVNVQVASFNVGDVKANLDSLDPQNAKKFMGYITEQFGDMLETELSRRSIG